MPEPSMPNEVLLDLLRSAWVIERARARVYETWAAEDPTQAEGAEVAEERSTIIAAVLEGVDGREDPDLIEAHSAWLLSVVGSHPDEVTLGSLFLARLGDWVQVHTEPFLGEHLDRMTRLGERERSRLRFPATFPPAPPFEPLDDPEAPAPPDVRLRVGILGDMHIGGRRAEERVRAAIADLNASGAELVIQLGDITDRGERSEFARAKEVLEELSMPIVTMLGNHDVFSTSEERLSGREYYSSTFEREPDGVLLEQAGFRFAVLDSAEHGASPFPPFDIVSGTLSEGPGGAIVRGSLTAPQHDLLADVAGPGGGPAFIFLHHPPQPFWGFPPILFGLREADSGRLHAVADSGNVWGIFAGHTHRCAVTRDYDGVPVREVGIPRDYPFGYGLLDIGANAYSYNFKQISNTDLLRAAYEDASEIHRRYGTGPPEARAFTWHAPV